MIRVKVDKFALWKACDRKSCLWIDEVPDFIEVDAEIIEDKINE